MTSAAVFPGLPALWPLPLLFEISPQLIASNILSGVSPAVFFIRFVLAGRMRSLLTQLTAVCQFIATIPHLYPMSVTM
jgi:hypothetical protein